MATHLRAMPVYWADLPFDSEDNSSHLDTAWRYSASVLRLVNTQLNEEISRADGVATVAIAGSYGRMEAGKHSDFDFFVIAENGSIKQRKDELRLIKQVWHSIRSMSLVPPDDNGIFTRVLTTEQFCDPAALGDLDYPRHVFGLRLQVLTDSQPLFGEANFEVLQRSILQWYLQPGYSPFSISPLQYLVSDLKRYFHSYSVWHQYRLDKTFNDSWLMRQIKMNHSRLTSYVSLLVCLLQVANKIESRNNSWREREIADEIISHLNSTPIERLIALWPETADCEPSDFLRIYDEVSGIINTQEMRQKIIDVEPAAVNDRRSIQGSILNNDELDVLVQSTSRIQQLLATCLAQVVQESSTAVKVLGAV